MWEMVSALLKVSAWLYPLRSDIHLCFHLSTISGFFCTVYPDAKQVFADNGVVVLLAKHYRDLTDSNQHNLNFVRSLGICYYLMKVMIPTYRIQQL
jgi:hypothetical protein